MQYSLLCGRPVAGNVAARRQMAGRRGSLAGGVSAVVAIRLTIEPSGRLRPVDSAARVGPRGATLATLPLVTGITSL